MKRHLQGCWPVLSGLLFAVALAPSSANACSCASFGPKSNFDGADLVFFAEAKAAQTEGDRRLQELTVLQSLKGEPGRNFLIDRKANILSTCDRNFNKGELGLVFVRKGKVGICSGNYDLQTQMRHMSTYLRGAGAAKDPSELGRIQVGIASALSQFGHTRPRIQVTYAPLAGQSATQGKTTLSFVKTTSKHHITLSAQSLGKFLLLSGRYEREGVSFAVLLQGKKIVGRWVVET